MKVQCSLLVVFLFALCPSAQTLSNQSSGPNVTVIQKKWRLEVRNPALEKDPLKEITEHEKEVRQRIETERLNEKLREQGMPTNERSPVLRPDTTRRGLSAEYIYEVKVRNTGKKGIRILTWDYVFFEPGTEREIGRRRFVSKVRIGSGRTRNVVMYSAIPPTGTVDASKADTKSGDQYSEQVVIQSVEYADGTVWQAASN